MTYGPKVIAVHNYLNLYHCPYLVTANKKYTCSKNG